MPMTTERPGVFRGSEYNRTAWYVVSPDADADASSEVQARLTERSAPTNRPRWQRATSTVLGWSAGLLAFVAAGVLIGLIPGRHGWDLLGAFLLLLALIGAGIAGVWVGSVIFPSRQPVGGHVSGVVEVHSSIAEWADDSLDRADLWELAVAVSRVEQVARRFWWATEEVYEASPEVVEDRVTPVLDAQFEEEAVRLIRVADRLRFTVPDEVWDREPRDD